MKRVFILVLVLALCFCGCAANTDPDETEMTTIEETTVSGLYVPQSSIERQTKGAVRRFDLTEQYQSVVQMGDKLLLVAQNESVQFTELIGDDCVAGKTTEIPLDSVWVATQTGLVYYDAANEEVVFLDSQMNLLKTVALTEKIKGDPVISADGGYVFYCTEQEIRVLETEHKISRLLKTHSGVDQKLLGSYFDGSMLACSFTDDEGAVGVEFLAADNGQNLATDNGISQLTTFGNTYMVFRQGGVNQQKIVGQRNESAQLLLTEGETFSALELGGMINCAPNEAGFVLDFIEVSSGKRTSSVSAEGFETPVALIADRWSGLLWLLATEASSGQQVLLSWNPELSLIHDDASYVGSLETLETPDAAGLDACQSRVDQMNKDYGVAIRIWEDAVVNTNGYTFVAEHRVGAINKTLDEMEQILKTFPARFLQNSSIKRIRILIVRSINSTVSSAFYWQNSDPTIVLCTGADVSFGLAKGIGYVVDSKILGGEGAYSGWESLNPEGFAYGASDTYSADCLAGERKAFLSESAMSSALEDRSQIFCQAMRPDQAENFASAVMQKKLKTVCENIRSAWNLTKRTEVFPWEQYLTEPIAQQG